jgi:hypothetical protein
VPDNPVRIEFLRKLHLFRGLKDNELAWVAEELKEKAFDEAGTVFVEGAAADSLCIIFQGRVDILRKVKDKGVATKVASLVRGDYFGEQGLLTAGGTRSASVIAERGTLILVLYRDQFKNLLKRVPGLHGNFDIMMSSRKLANELKFTWLAENEIIYFLTRKHPFLLVRALTWPVLFLFPMLGILAFAFWLEQNALPFGWPAALVGGFFLVLDLLWGLWQVVDWGNDYYIVTNQRVIWLEKVIGLYDSRTEAGVGTILSVSTEIDYWGRMWDYGTVVVRTFTGQIRLTFVRHPKQAAAMIEEYWNRAKEGGRKADEDIMKQAIRTKLGLKKSGPPPAPAAPSKPVKKVSPLAAWWQNLFRMRSEDGNVITYHKHVFVFFRDASPYILGIFGLLAGMILWPIFLSTDIPLWVVLLVAVAILALFGFIAYEYADWKNDIYQVTPEQIIDVNRKPFGTEDRKAAPLENILSTEYKRRGLLGMFLNFGTVFIMVGGAQFNFEDVIDPPTVQQDIVRRQAGRVAKKRENDSAGERDRMAEWLAMYKRTLDEIEQEKQQTARKSE